MHKLTVLTELNNFSCKNVDLISFFLEYPPDNKFTNSFPNNVPMEKIIGNHEDIVKLSCVITNNLLLQEPLLRNVAQLSIFKEQISWEIQKIIRILNFHDFLIKNDILVCEFISLSWWSEQLEKIVKFFDSPIEVKVINSKKENKLKRILSRLYSSKLELKSINAELNHIINWMDKFHRRSIFLGKFKSSKYPPNQPWFYSTSLTFSNIALLYAPYFNNHLNYLVENPLTGGFPLKQHSKHFNLLYDFARYSFIPSLKEIKKSTTMITSYLNEKTLSHFEEIIKNLFIESNWFHMFLTRLLPIGLFTSSICHRWINTVNPSALIVGNFVFEGYALHAAKINKIPTVLLQHGTMGAIYKYIDLPVDYHIVRGEFWRDQLKNDIQHRVFALNPINSPKKCFGKKNTLLFLTCPFQLRGMLPIQVDLDSILSTLFSTIETESITLVVRVHPNERIIDYKIKIQRLLVNKNTKFKLIYSQNTDIDLILKETLAVLTFGSTIIFDCIKHNVPIISFDWYHFWFKNLIKPFHIIHFAKNLESFRHLIINAITENLKINYHNENSILANTPDSIINVKINEIIDKKYLLT